MGCGYNDLTPEHYGSINLDIKSYTVVRVKPSCFSCFLYALRMIGKFKHYRFSELMDMYKRGVYPVQWTKVSEVCLSNTLDPLPVPEPEKEEILQES